MASLSDIDLRKSLGKDIVIHPLRNESITPVGYDLRIGLAINLLDPVNVSAVESDFPIPASTSALIIAKEKVWLSGRILATLHSRGSYAARGLIINSTTVDPNWSGQMTFLVHNSSRHDFVVKKDDPFITMVLHYVKTPTKSESNGNPISVVQRYSESYGNDVGNAVNTYSNSTANLAEKREYDTLIRNATTFSSWRVISVFFNRLVSILTSFRGVSILVLWVLLFGFVAIPLYWDFISKILHNIEYDSKVFAGQMAAISAIVIAIIQQTKR